MISIVLYGRNDSHGYNLHKRAAISLNCMAEVLTDRDDEILFVDCNTPDDMPTFPQAIQDTLTQKAKEKLRIFRIRPNLYEKHKRGSPLSVLEPLSRNVAIRRSNPRNRWILCSNSDMVFVPRTSDLSLSEVVKDLPDGFFELPRFEIPEALWENVNRSDPASILSAFRRWGQALHLNEVIHAEPHILYDGPGDFQLVLREQLFGIHGFNEAMVWGANLDANLCRRLYILNGRVESLLDQVFAYHCDHTRQSTYLHKAGRTENDRKRFDYSVTTPYLADQAATWGLPDESPEEIRLEMGLLNNFERIIGKILPGIPNPVIEDVLLCKLSFNHGLLYDNFHALPFIADQISTVPPMADIGYFGGNIELLNLISEFRMGMGHGGRILVERTLFTKASPQTSKALPAQCELFELKHVAEKSYLFMFDPSMAGFPQTKNEVGIAIPEATTEVITYNKMLVAAFNLCADREARRMRRSTSEVPRKFLFISGMHTWFETAASRKVGIVLAPYSTRVRHGYVYPTSLFTSLRNRLSRIKWSMRRFCSGDSL